MARPRCDHFQAFNDDAALQAPHGKTVERPVAGERGRGEVVRVVVGQRCPCCRWLPACMCGWEAPLCLPCAPSRGHVDGCYWANFHWRKGEAERARGG